MMAALVPHDTVSDYTLCFVYIVFIITFVTLVKITVLLIPSTLKVVGV